MSNPPPDHDSRDAPPQRPLGRAGIWALGLFTLHTTLLFFPPIPPDVKGSLWSYILAYLAVILGAFELRHHAARMAHGWGALRPSRRVQIGVGTALTALLSGLALRWVSPELFSRWGRVEGVFEPLTITAYVVSVWILAAAADGQAPQDRRYLHFFALGYILLVLEEIDYLGIFGGIVGRVNGVYVGSPHDLLGLAAEGLLAPWMLALAVTVVAAFTGILFRTGHLQPIRLLRTVFAPRGLWLLAGIVALGLAQIEDLGVHYFFGDPRIEEMLEMVASFFFLGFAGDLAGRAAGGEGSSGSRRS